MTAGLAIIIVLSPPLLTYTRERIISNQPNDSIPNTITVEPVTAYKCPKCNLTMGRNSTNKYYCMTPSCDYYQVTWAPRSITLQRFPQDPVEND